LCGTYAVLKTLLIRRLVDSLRRAHMAPERLRRVREPAGHALAGKKGGGDKSGCRAFRFARRESDSTDALWTAA